MPCTAQSSGFSGEGTVVTTDPPRFQFLDGLHAPGPRLGTRAAVSPGGRLDLGRVLRCLRKEGCIEMNLSVCTKIRGQPLSYSGCDARKHIFTHR